MGTGHRQLLLDLVVQRRIVDALRLTRAPSTTSEGGWKLPERVAGINQNEWPKTLGIAILDRTNQCNVARPRLVTTTAGDIELTIPQFAQRLVLTQRFSIVIESTTPTTCVVLEVWVSGYSTRKVDNLVGPSA